MQFAIWLFSFLAGRWAGREIYADLSASKLEAGMVVFMTQWECSPDFITRLLWIWPRLNSATQGNSLESASPHFY